MRNFAFRKVFIILAEKLAALETIYEDKMLAKDTNAEFLKSCKQNLDQIKTDLLSNKQILLESYNNELLSQEKVEEALLSLKKCAGNFFELHSLLGYLQTNFVLPETFTFLKETLKTQVSSKSPIVLLSQNYSINNIYNNFSNLSNASYLPILESINPLFWGLLIKENFSNNCDEFSSDLAAAKLLGPAYYHSIIEYEVLRNIANRNNTSPLAVREELIYTSLISSLPQSGEVENTHNWFINLAQLSDELNTALGFKVDKNALNIHITEQINENEGIFNQSDITKSSIINCERFQNKVLASSSYIHNLDSIRNDYNKAYEQPSEEFNIYEHLNKLKEVPNTPQQIVNAGWMYKTNTIDKVFFEFLNDSNNKENSNFSYLVDYVGELNNLLVKSIEISTIHKILNNEE